MSCRHSHSIPHDDDVCLDCECLAPEKCVEHQQLHPVDKCIVGLKKFDDGTASSYYCYTHEVWGKDWK